MSVEIVGSNFNCIMKNCCTINYFQILTVISSHTCTKVQYCFNIVNLFYQTYGCMRPNQRVLFFVSWLYYKNKKNHTLVSFVTSPASRISFCTALISFSTWRTLFLTSTSSLANWLCFSFSCSLCLSSGFRSAEWAVCSWINCCLAWQRKHH